MKTSLLIPAWTGALALTFAPPTALAQRDEARPLGESKALIQNLGQWPEFVRFATESGRLRLRAEQSGIGIDLLGQRGEGAEVEGAYLRLEFVGGGGSGPLGLQRGETLRHYYQGQGPEDWFTEVPEFAEVLWDEVWPGIDVRLGRRDGKWAYDLEVEPGADPSRIRIELQGADALNIDPNSAELVAWIGVGALRQSRPVLWYEAHEGGRSEASGGFRLLGGGAFGFELDGPRQPARLVIDPGFDFVSYLGGANLDRITSLEVDAQDRLIFGGSTRSPEFPSVPGPFPYVANSDAVIGRLRLEPSPALDFVAFVGGNADDELFDLALGPGDRIFVGGKTNSKNFPLSPDAVDPLYTQPFSDSEGWVTALRPEANGLVYSTYLGGQNASDWINAIAVDALGVATVVGRTSGSGFPTTPGAFKEFGFPGAGDGTISRLAADGKSFVYSTLVGGIPNSEEFMGVAVDAAGRTYVCGRTGGNDYPTTPGVFKFGEFGGLLTVLDPTGSALVASTWIGGTASGTTDFNDLCLGPEGNLHVCGFTMVPGFPVTPGAFDTIGVSESDREVVVFEITPDLRQIVHGTYLGKNEICCNSFQSAACIRVDAGGVVTVVGSSSGSSTNVQTTQGSAMPNPFTGSNQPFISRFAPKLDRLLYGSHMNASIANGPSGEGLAVFPDGRAACSGLTQSLTSLPVTPNAIQPTAGGNIDGFLAVFDMLPFGAVRFGEWTSPCAESIWIGVTEQPRPGSSTFGLLASGAPANAVGFLALSLSPLPAPVPILDLDVWIDPSTLLLFLPGNSDPIGFTETPLPLPATSQGKTLCCQYLWLNPPGCGLPASFSSSSALALTVQ